MRPVIDGSEISEVKAVGGSPYQAYVWIEDNLYRNAGQQVAETAFIFKCPHKLFAFEE